MKIKTLKCMLDLDSGSKADIIFRRLEFDTDKFDKYIHEETPSLFLVKLNEFNDLVKNPPGRLKVYKKQAGGKQLWRYFHETGHIAIPAKYGRLGDLKNALHDVLTSDIRKKICLTGVKDKLFDSLKPTDSELLHHPPSPKTDVISPNMTDRPGKTALDENTHSTSTKSKYLDEIQLNGPEDLPGFFKGESKEAYEVRELIIRAATVPGFRDIPVLILGSTGSGKEPIAQAIHKLTNPKVNRVWVELNCSAIPEKLLEAELFGTTKGIATGVDSRIGLWEFAGLGKGTLFLDEIGELSLEHQAKLLRALQEKKIRRIGETTDRSVADARVIAATNRDLVAMIDQGLFRHDLYTRLARLVIRTPPFGDRPTDIELMAKDIWQTTTENRRTPLSPEIIDVLKRYSWPGGVRELQDVLLNLDFHCYNVQELQVRHLQKVMKYIRSGPITSDIQTEPEVLTATETNGPTDSVTKRADISLLHDQVEQYKHDRPTYVLFSEVLQQILEKAAREKAFFTFVLSRAKSIAGFAEKLCRNHTRETVRDLCAARVIVQTSDQVKSICSFLENYFEIDRANSIGPDRVELGTELGFRPVSYVVRLDRSRLKKLERILGDTIPDKVLTLWAEVQVRTVLEHAWSEISREAGRDTPLSMPAKLNRELMWLGEVLRTVDKSFSRIQKELQAFITSSPAYMTSEQLQREIKILERVLECDPGNIRVAARIGKLAIALEDWEMVIKTLKAYKNSGYPPVLKDLGIATCQKYRDNPESEEYAHGQALLAKACEEPYPDPDALASLAGTWKRRGKKEKALALYRRAHKIDEADPYALGNYMETELCLDPAGSIVTVLKPQIRAAVERCRDHAVAGINLPWAFFDLGKFLALLDERAESFAAYTRAVRLSTSSHMIRTSLDSLNLFFKVGKWPPGFQTAKALLALGWAAGFPSKEARLHLQGILSPHYEIKSPVVFVAGGRDEYFSGRGPEYGLLFKEAFRDFSGTIIYDCGITGVAELVSNLHEGSSETLGIIGYSPGGVPLINSRLKRSWKIRHTTGTEPTILEALQAWKDIILSKISPSNVLVLGFGGNTLDAERYMPALALSARVMVIQEPDDSTEPVMANTYWENVKGINVIPPPPDAAVLRAMLPRNSGS